MLGFPSESTQVTRTTGQGNRAAHGFFFNFMDERCTVPILDLCVHTTSRILLQGSDYLQEAALLERLSCFFVWVQEFLCVCESSGAHTHTKSLATTIQCICSAWPTAWPLLLQNEGTIVTKNAFASVAGASRCRRPLRVWANRSAGP
jgi:hypothetical protein